jgi:hypothetical protein
VCGVRLPRVDVVAAESFRALVDICPVLGQQTRVDIRR